MSKVEIGPCIECAYGQHSITPCYSPPPLEKWHTPFKTSWMMRKVSGFWLVASRHWLHQMDTSYININKWTLLTWILKPEERGEDKEKLCVYDAPDYATYNKKGGSCVHVGDLHGQQSSLRLNVHLIIPCGPRHVIHSPKDLANLRRNSFHIFIQFHPINPT